MNIEQCITFWGDLLSDLDPEILFLFCLITICKIHRRTTLLSFAL